MASNRFLSIIGFLVLILLPAAGCFRYSATGTSIPSEVNSIYIPFFPDQSDSSLGNLSNQLNKALVDRFVNSTRLQLANSRGKADAIISGSIVSYSNKPFTIAGDDETSQNRVSITVEATFSYKHKEEPQWRNKRFQKNAYYDPRTNPIQGENNAASEALKKIAENMFNEAVGQW